MITAKPLSSSKGKGTLDNGQKPCPFYTVSRPRERLSGGDVGGGRRCPLPPLVMGSGTKIFYTAIDHTCSCSTSSPTTQVLVNSTLECSLTCVRRHRSTVCHFGQCRIGSGMCSLVQGPSHASEQLLAAASTAYQLHRRRGMPLKPLFEDLSSTKWRYTSMHLCKILSVSTNDAILQSLHRLSLGLSPGLSKLVAR